MCFRDVLDDFLLTTKYYPDDTDVKLLQETLLLAHEMLEQDPDQLPAQIVGRIKQVSD